MAINAASQDLRIDVIVEHAEMPLTDSKVRSIEIAADKVLERSGLIADADVYAGAHRRWQISSQKRPWIGGRR